MSEEQLSALLAKLKQDAGLKEKLKGAADLDTAVSLAKAAGFDVSKEDWLSHQAKQNVELNDADLEGVAGGGKDPRNTKNECPATEKVSIDVKCSEAW